ncbi:MAG: cytidylate kinase-like family protein [Deltaproteobacteria bacterium]|nr:MAG: cytidylate kinase-like family protein [Deltaproteobacteria bacterium]
MAIITISREMGSGGIPVAHKVAEKLGYQLIDGEMIMAAAEAYGLSAEAVEQADEKPPHFVDTLDSKQFLDLHLIELIILEAALKGNVVIYGRGGQDLLKDVNSVLRTRIIAPFEDRVERWAEREWLDPDRARYLVRKSDQQRAGFIKYYFDRDWDDSVHYDLVINTQRLSEDKAVEVICDSVKDENLEGVKASGKKLLTDLILRKKVEIAILSSENIDAYMLEISVEDGIVILAGQLHSNAEKAAAEKQACSVEGVNDLQNDIKVVEYRTNPSEH